MNKRSKFVVCKFSPRGFVNEICYKYGRADSEELKGLIATCERNSTPRIHLQSFHNSLEAAAKRAERRMKQDKIYLKEIYDIDALIYTEELK